MTHLSSGSYSEPISAAVLAAAIMPSVALQHPGGTRVQLTLAWSRQTDVRIVRRSIPGELDDHIVAAYVAKYSSKGAEDIGGVPHRIQSPADLDTWHVTPHVRRMITACWQLGQRPEYASLHLARWAHQLRYGGWFSTRSHRYSVTLGSRLRERRDNRTAWTRQPAETDVAACETAIRAQIHATSCPAAPAAIV